MTTLEGKTALVTGSTKGIGYATAARLLSAGARVVVHGRTEESVTAARSRLGSSPLLVSAPADLTAPDGWRSLLHAVPTEIDILVNNAAIFRYHDWLHVSPSDWATAINVNALAGYYLTAALLPGMTARGWGRCIFVSSENAVVSPPDRLGPYAVTKAIQIVLSRLFAQAAPSGSDVTVNTVLPGPTTTEGQDAIVTQLLAERDLATPADALSAILGTRPRSLLGRMTTPDEVASLIVYLASPDASGTTGAILTVDGGITWHV